MKTGGGGYWATKTYRSGRIGEKVKFYVPECRARKQRESSPSKILSNSNNAVRRAARIVNENFRPGDGFFSLNYDERRYKRVIARAERMDHAIPEADRIYLSAQHEVELLMDRVRPALRKAGVELRYFAITSDMDGATGEYKRVHHHIICPRECVETIKRKWGLTGEGVKQRGKEMLWALDDYTQTVEYMMKQVRHIPNAKKYVTSRNLIRTEPTPRTVFTGARLREPKGSVLLYADPYTGRHDCQYIRYILPPEKWTGVWKGRGGEPGGFPDTKHARASARH